MIMLKTNLCEIENYDESSQESEKRKIKLNYVFHIYSQHWNIREKCGNAVAKYMAIVKKKKARRMNFFLCTNVIQCRNCKIKISTT